jgi:asparagine synthase (glutamine-hydrolysing)
MCGIAGIVDKTGALGADELVRLASQMGETMQHRGPDDAGVWLSPDRRVAFSHRRLSIIDPSPGGHQPMLDAQGRRAITYNGELYNFRELRCELETCGGRFRTRSDTEVLLAALAQWNVGAFARLDAMFALGYYDADRRTLVLARDIFGEKPLYYVDTDRYLAFASELNALTLLPDFDAGVDLNAIAAYLSFQYLPAPSTIYRCVRKLPPGCWLRLGPGAGVEEHRYFTFRTDGRQSTPRALDDLADELEALLVTTVNRRLVSDVPLGAFLSGGVDSATVAAIATRKLGVALETFSIGFEGHRDSEHLEAAETARHLGTQHADRLLSADAIELGRHIGRVLDEPNGDTSCLSTFLLAGFARESVTVALSGDGGDELFGGYGRYFNTVEEWTRRRAGDRSLAWWQAGSVYLSSRVLVYPDDELARLMGRIPPPHAERLGELRGRVDGDGRPLINVLRELDAETYLPGAVLAKVDRMSMQHSLEVRAPLLGIDVARFAMGLAAEACYAEGQGKLVLKRVAERHLPADWMRRPKRGFGLPMDMWGAETLMPALERLLLDRTCRLAEWIAPGSLQRYVQRLGREFHAYRAWSLFVLESWLREHPATPARYR